MSKAFTKEGDGASADEVQPIDEWPAGVTNYLTPAGLAALRRRIEETREAARVDAARRQTHEQRLAALLRRLEAAEVIEPAAQPPDVVRFGATVTVEDEEGAERRYRIVGVDEADPRRGLVSWRSPVAAALVGRRTGETTILRTPGGTEELVVASITYGE